MYQFYMNNPVISNDLKWVDHIKYITNKANSRLFLLFKSVQSCDSEFLTKIYNVYIRSLLDYGSSIYNSSSKQNSQKIEKVQNREELAYYFEFPHEKSTEAARLIGANNQCDLWADLSEAARIVPKLAVILHQPDAFQSRNWNSGVASTFPGARLLLEGQTDLAIVVSQTEAKKTPVKLSSAK